MFTFKEDAYSPGLYMVYYLNLYVAYYVPGDGFRFKDDTTFTPEMLVELIEQSKSL